MGFSAIWKLITEIFFPKPEPGININGFERNNSTCDYQNNVLRPYHYERAPIITQLQSPEFIRKENHCPNSLVTISLPEYPVSKEAINITNGGECPRNVSEWLMDDSIVRRNANSYIDFFKMMIYLEEADELKGMQKNNLNHLTIYPLTGKQFYFRIAPGMDSLIKAIEKKEVDRFTLETNSTEMNVNGNFKGKDGDKVYIELMNPKKWCATERYDLKIQLNRSNFQLQHYALNLIKNHKLFNHLIDHPYYQQTFECATVNQRCSTNLSNLNEEQNKVVNDILKGSHYPLPYIIYGPPGTGKTNTLVISIKQIIETTQKYVLVCAQSNSACDEIAERLSELLTVNQMLRMYSASREIEDINPKLKDYCNLFKEKLMYPSLDYIYKYRVVICTLSVAGVLTRARKNRIFSPRHFSYIIIDECASTHETMALIPIVGLSTKVGIICTNIILSGDPKQLDAVTKSDWAKKLGFSKSWLERLITLPLYQMGITQNKRNSVYVTQLVKNYRSHPTILHIPNELFYNGVLKAITSPNLLDLKLNIPRLNNTFPIIFKSIQGYQKRLEGQTSSYNDEEVNTVVDYIRQLLEKTTNLTQLDIGIVSPYKLQCTKISSVCKRMGFENIQIGTTEIFQGQEKKVMIVSAVIARRKNPGDFMSNPQRMNVILTRAQYLLIVIGDPHTLSKDSNWSQFINYCCDNRALIQSNRPFPRRSRRK